MQTTSLAAGSLYPILARLVGAPVVPDRGGQGENALQDADGDAGNGAAGRMGRRSGRRAYRSNPASV
jgi:hypothetical protein